MVPWAGIACGRSADACLCWYPCILCSTWSGALLVCQCACSSDQCCLLNLAPQGHTSESPYHPLSTQTGDRRYRPRRVSEHTGAIDTIISVPVGVHQLVNQHQGWGASMSAIFTWRHSEISLRASYKLEASRYCFRQQVFIDLAWAAVHRAHLTSTSQATWVAHLLLTKGPWRRHAALYNRTWWHGNRMNQYKWMWKHKALHFLWGQSNHIAVVTTGSYYLNEVRERKGARER